MTEHLEPVRVTIGFAISTLGGALALWVLIEQLAWTYIEKHGAIARPSGLLTLPLGICERASYTTAILMGAPSWIGVWLAIKVAASWSRWSGDNRATYNVFLLGNLLSIGFGVLGAWVALGRFPSLADVLGK